MHIDSAPVAARAVPYPSRQAWRIFAALLFGTFVTIEASAFQAPALSAITRHFAIPASMAGVMTLLYYLGATVFAPVMGALGDGFGRKRMVMIGLAVFSASEFLAAVSPTIWFLIAMRFLQGIGVACILPTVLATISDLFDRDQRGLPLGVMAFAMGIGATTGALLAGLLIVGYGWRSIYIVSGVLAIIGLILVAKLVPPLRSGNGPRRLDLRGTLLLFLTLGGFLPLPTLVGNLGLFSPWVLLALCIGSVSAVTLWRTSTHNPQAVIHTDLLKKREFTLPGIVYLLHLLAYAGMTFCLAFILPDRPGGSAADVGFVNLFTYGASAIGAPLAGKLIDRFDARYVLMTALLVMLVGLLALAQVKADTSLIAIAAIAGVIGFVTGAKTPAVMKIALGKVPTASMGRGAGLLTLMRDVGSPAGAMFSLAIYSATVGKRLHDEVMSRTINAGLGSEWLPALEKLIATRGNVIDPALQTELTARGIEVPSLLQSATATAINTALPTVGFALAGFIAVAIVLAWFALFSKRKIDGENIGVEKTAT